MTAMISDHHNDLGVKDQGQIYLKSVLRLVMQTPSFFTQGVHISQKVCLWCVDYKEGFRSSI